MSRRVKLLPADVVCVDRFLGNLGEVSSHGLRGDVFGAGVHVLACDSRSILEGAKGHGDEADSR